MFYALLQYVIFCVDSLGYTGLPEPGLLNIIPRPGYGVPEPTEGVAAVHHRLRLGGAQRVQGHQALHFINVCSKNKTKM